MNQFLKIKSIIIIVLISLTGLAGSCAKEPVEPTENGYEIGHLSKPAVYAGIPLLTFDMAKYRSTEMSSEYVVRSSPSVISSMSIARNGYNSALIIEYEGMESNDDYLEYVVSVFEKIPDDQIVPRELTSQVIGVSFRAVSPEAGTEISLQVLDPAGNPISSGMFSIERDSMKTYTLDFNPGDIKKLLFRIDLVEQSNEIPLVNRFIIDDIYLVSNLHEEFVPPADDEQFLAWLKECSIRYFRWNYREVGTDMGIVLESAGDNTKVSLSGLGYALANFILADMDGILTAADAESKVLSVLKWLKAQNWFDGSHGWHGFPKHYFNREGTYYSSDISTIDWAMCAAGIRVARQYFSENTEIVSIATELLNRADWSLAVGSDGRIAMGFNESDGTMNPYRWGLAFSEETELVYLEALASGKLQPAILDNIIREKEQGFYPSWFGCGFTYNWLQLWTGPVEPYRSNSIAAYSADAETSADKFGLDLIGLTACATIQDITDNGFINWGRYISNQGSTISGASATEVIQISPAPYGAALALPFIPDKAIEALRVYVNLGYYHPLLGLPDNIRLSNLPSGLSPAPNWNAFDINTGPIALAIEQSRENRIGALYQNDTAIQAKLPLLIESFNF